MATPAAEVLENLVKVYESGVVLSDLAQQFGVSIPTVSKWVVKGGGKIRPRGQRPKANTKVFATEEVSEVETVEEVLEAFDVEPTARTIFAVE